MSNRIYIKWVHPQIPAGRFHATPLKPLCLKNYFDKSFNWDFHSSDDNDRSEYWEIDMVEHAKVADLLPLMTAEEVYMEVYGQTTKPVITYEGDL